MIDLTNDQLILRFPEVHRDAVLGVAFLRALRASAGTRLTERMPRLGAFPLRHVDDHAPRVPAGWTGHGDVMLPIHPTESLWLNFGASYPFAVQVAAGGRDAVTGKPFSPGLTPRRQSHLVVPEQVWLDGYADESGAIRPFVAASPVADAPGWAGDDARITLVAYPMEAESFTRVASQYKWQTRDWWTGKGKAPLAGRLPFAEDGAGHLPGHTIAEDPHRLESWDQSHGIRCVVHLVAARDWERLTGEAPSTTAPTASDYADAGLPWDAHFQEGAAT